MSTKEHLLAIVEPTTGGDATIELAQEAVARGGKAKLVMVITDRVKRDIRAFAESEVLDGGVAEAIAIDRLSSRYRDRIGGPVQIEIHYGAIGSDVVRYVTADTTAIAIPDRLIDGKLIQRLVAYSGRPVIVAPSPSALSSTRAEVMVGV